MRARMQARKFEFVYNIVCQMWGRSAVQNSACGHPSFAFLDLFLLRKKVISLRDITSVALQLRLVEDARLPGLYAITVTRTTVYEKAHYSFETARQHSNIQL